MMLQKSYISNKCYTINLWILKNKIAFKVVQIKFLAMHITNQKLSLNILTVQNIFIEHDRNILMIFGLKEKW